MKSDSMTESPLTLVPARRKPSPVEHQYNHTALTRFVIAVLLFGWWFTNINYEPGSDLGYRLAVAGGVMTVVLLFCPLLKYTSLSHTGVTQTCGFRAHLFLGVIAPVFFLLHSRLKYDSFDGALAVIAMAAILVSYLVGRFVCAKIHHGFAGNSKTDEELKRRHSLAQKEVRSYLFFAPPVLSLLKDYQTIALSESRERASIWRLITIGIQTRLAYLGASRELTRALERLALIQGWRADKLERRLARGKGIILRFLQTVRAQVEFQAYERIYFTWLRLHVPLLFLAVSVGSAHVFLVYLP
jgi:hypothetical protein